MMIVNNNQFRKQEFEKRRVFKKGTSLCNAYSCPIFQNCLLEIKQLQQENARLKEKINKANILTKKIKDDVWAKTAECYENEDNWNGDFLNIEINSIDRLLEMLKEN